MFLNEILNNLILEIINFSLDKEKLYKYQIDNFSLATYRIHYYSKLIIHNHFKFPDNKYLLMTSRTKIFYWYLSRNFGEKNSFN